MAPTSLLDDGGIEAPSVGALKHQHPRVGPQLGVELVVPDIHGIDLGRAAREQNLGEAPRRSADVESHPPLGLESEGVERCLKFERAARDVT